VFSLAYKKRFSHWALATTADSGYADYLRKVVSPVARGFRATRRVALDDSDYRTDRLGSNPIGTEACLRATLRVMATAAFEIVNCLRSTLRDMLSSGLAGFVYTCRVPNPAAEAAIVAARHAHACTTATGGIVVEHWLHMHRSQTLAPNPISHLTRWLALNVDDVGSAALACYINLRIEARLGGTRAWK
jgi:hypothetical protein